MSRKRRQKSAKRATRSRKLRCELLEDRCMLATMVDIVFLVDESQSDTDTPTQEWLAALVTGDVDRSGTIDTGEESLATKLGKPEVGITDVRYGLAGFGESIDQSPSAPIDRYAHSQLFEEGNPDSLFGDSDDLTTAELNKIFGNQTQTPAGNLAQFGGIEGGWDALEHAIAEYDFREGAVPIVVLVQNDEGRVVLNDTLTRDGVLAALQSKNAILNVLVTSEAVARDGDGGPLGHSDLFVINGAGMDERVLGVEADEVDGVIDRMHNYHGFDTVAHVATSGQFDDTPTTLDDIDGETTTVIINGVKVGGETESSLGNQITRADMEGRVFREDKVVAAINLGGFALNLDGVAGIDVAAGDYTADPVTPTATNSLTTGNAFDTSSNAIPEAGDPAMKVVDVFASSRTVNSGNTTSELFHLDINTLASGEALTDGVYVVELFFAELDLAVRDDGPGSERKFDVELEETLVLDDYFIMVDHAKIEDFGSAPIVELESARNDRFTGVVKRFQVDVTGGDGLQIDLTPTAITHDPILAGVRVIDVTGPQVTKVEISSLNDPNLSHDFSADPALNQITTIPVGVPENVTLTFSADVDLTTIASDSIGMIGLRTANAPTATLVGTDPVAHSATWTFTGFVDNSQLQFDHYALVLKDTVTDMAGNALDGEWTNPLTNTSLLGSTFPSGNGQPGGEFVFMFTLLNGDFDGNNVINNDDIPGFVAAALSPAVDPLADVNGDGADNNDDIPPFVALLLNPLNLQNVLVYADVDGNSVIDQTDFDMYNANPSAYDLNDDGIFGDAEDTAIIVGFEMFFSTFGISELEIQLA